MCKFVYDTKVQNSNSKFMSNVLTAVSGVAFSRKSLEINLLFFVVLKRSVFK